MSISRILGLGALVALASTVACTTETGDAADGAESDLNGVRGSLDVTTRNYDNDRTGVNSHETTLNVDNVKASSGKFHKLFSIPVDEKIETFPLYVAGSPRNFLYVTTMNNSVYAFDADTGKQLWQRSLGTAVSGPAFARVKPATVNGKYGIGSTPVIDTETGTMYVVRWAVEGPNATTDVVQRLFILKLSDGSDQQPSVKIDASASVDGHTATFDHRGQIIRASLLLLKKQRADGGVDKAVVVTAAGGESPTSPHGWVLAYDVAHLQNQALGTAPAAWCTTPKTGAAGIWMAGGGPSGDDQGNIYFATGNGRYDGQTEFGESFVKLAYTASENGDPAKLEVASSFTPFQDIHRDNRHQDQDLGSAAPLLIPGTNIVAGGGKDGILYVMDRDDMGREDFSKLKQPPFVASYVPTPGSDPVKNLDIISSHDPPTQSQVDGGRIHHIHSTPVFWHSPNAGPLLYIWGENALLRAISFDGNRFGTSPLAKGNVSPSAGTPGIGGMPGGMITLSANGDKPNTGIVWGLHAINGDANKQVVKGILRAYDASNFVNGSQGKMFVELWNSEMDPADSIGNGAKVVPPMVASGHVYAVTYDNKVNVYGLR
jgi:outer membrane protein assembly factor BamB